MDRLEPWEQVLIVLALAMLLDMGRNWLGGKVGCRR